MSIYLVQHGKALTKEVDKNRSLSVDGRQETESVAQKLGKLELAIENICHSGKTRAAETAELLAMHLGNCGISEIAGMAPNDDVIQFSAAIHDNTMYVGHLPHLDKLLSFLTCGNQNSNVLQFTNSAVVCLKKTDQSYSISWYITPGICKIF